MNETLAENFAIGAEFEAMAAAEADIACRAHDLAGAMPGGASSSRGSAWAESAPVLVMKRWSLG